VRYGPGLNWFQSFDSYHHAVEFWKIKGGVIETTSITNYLIECERNEMGGSVPVTGVSGSPFKP
jgi:hypothetical protein